MTKISRKYTEDIINDYVYVEHIIILNLIYGI
jgi:hypothetical protein